MYFRNARRRAEAGVQNAPGTGVHAKRTVVPLKEPGAYEFKAISAAIHKSQAVVELQMDGTILWANENFLRTFGYTLDEMQGRHHAILVGESERDTESYRAFWEKLNRGEYQADEYKRVSKGGKEVWIQASYNPILDKSGKPFKVVIFAADVTGLRRTLMQIVQQAQELGNSSETLSSMSRQVASNAEKTVTQTAVVSTASDDVSKNASALAAESKQLMASMHEISKSAAESTQVTKTALGVAESARKTIARLDESSSEIGKEIKTITSIAQQTNLLALNATIEAARAGEAGKGLAVVASEVKELARETARAAAEIGRKIEAIQGETKGAVVTIAEMRMIVDRIDDLSGSIASAIEQQCTKASELGCHVTDTASGVGEIATNLCGVAETAQRTTQGTANTQDSVAALSRKAGELLVLVSRV